MPWFCLSVGLGSILKHFESQDAGETMGVRKENLWAISFHLFSGFFNDNRISHSVLVLNSCLQGQKHNEMLFSMGQG